MFCKICERLPFQHRLYARDKKDLEILKAKLNAAINEGSLICSSDSSIIFSEKEYSCSDCKRIFTWLQTKNAIFHFGLQPNLQSKYLNEIQELCFENAISESFRGMSPYTNDDPTEWVGFNCLYNEHQLKKRFSLPETVTYTEYFGFSAGADSTFFDSETKEGLMGLHPRMAETFKDVKLIK